MKQFCFIPAHRVLTFLLAVITACSAQPNSNPGSSAMPETDTPIDQYVVELFEDSKGNLWFGTMSSGVARYTPSTLLRAGEKTLTYFSEKDGLPGTTVVSIAEDKAGNMWFGTHSGLSKYDWPLPPPAHKSPARWENLYQFHPKRRLVPRSGIQYPGRPGREYLGWHVGRRLSVRGRRFFRFSHPKTGC
nr:two-component regulator propeller domain-containing protein [Haliscomenobacter sp.]